MVLKKERERERERETSLSTRELSLHACPSFLEGLNEREERYRDERELAITLTKKEVIRKEWYGI